MRQIMQNSSIDSVGLITKRRIMNLVTWNSSFETGIQEIDNQHLKLVDILNHLYKTYIQKNEGNGVRDVLESLEDYAKYHFSTEEKLMRMHNFEKTERHILEHKNFTTQVTKFKENINFFDDNEMIKLINFMRDWLISHIQGSDREYIGCIKN